MALNQSFLPELATMRFEDVPTDSRLIYKAALTSANDLDGGVVTGTATYNANGVSNGGSAYIRWTPTAGEQALLAKSCHIHYEIEASFMDTITANAQRIMTLGSAAQKIYIGNSSRVVSSQLFNGYNDVGSLSVNGGRSESHVVFDEIYIGNTSLTYMNGLLQKRTAGTVTPSFSTITMFASNTGTEIWGASSGSTARIKNFYVTTGVPMLRTSHDVGNITIFGDSLSQQGNLQSTHPLFTGSAGNGTFGDYGMTARIIGGLGRIGIRPNLINRAVSGYTLANVQTLVGTLPHLANHDVIVGIGTNDVSSGTLTAGFETNCQTLVDSLTTLGARHIFFSNVPSTGPDTTYPDSLTGTAVDNACTAIANVVAANSNCSLNDLFTLFGGHNYNADWYQANNRHWNVTGSYKAGELILKNIKDKYYLA